MKEDEESRLRTWAIRASRLADYAICSWGKHGLILASNGHAILQPAIFVPDNLVVDTLGAGDRVHAAAIDAIRCGKTEEEIALCAATEAAKVIQYIGAHGDLYDISG